MQVALRPEREREPFLAGGSKVRLPEHDVVVRSDAECRRLYGSPVPVRNRGRLAGSVKRNERERGVQVESPVSATADVEQLAYPLCGGTQDACLVVRIEPDNGRVDQLLKPSDEIDLAHPAGFSHGSTLTGMRRVFVTGMSGAGKSSALAALARLGFQVVDTDEPGWTEWSDDEGGYVWREDRITELLAREGGSSLYVSGTVSNQGRFYARFDAVVLLSAPAEVLLARIEKRTTNSFGKSPGQRELILRDLAEVEPLLRRTCTHEIDARQPLASVVDELAQLGREPSA